MYICKSDLHVKTQLDGKNARDTITNQLLKINNTGFNVVRSPICNLRPRATN